MTRSGSSRRKTNFPPQRTSSPESQSDGFTEPPSRAAPAKAESAQAAVETFVVSTRGPLPSPVLLRAYGEVVPDAPHRIIMISEKNQDAQIAVQTHNMQMERRGQLFGWVLALLFLGSAVFLISKGSVAFGGTAVLATIGSVTAALFQGKRYRG